MVDTNYWSERAEKLEENIFKDTLKFENKLMQTFSQSAREVEKEIMLFVSTYAKDNKLSFAEASKNLTPIEKADYNRQMKQLLAEYKETGSEITLERIEHLEARKVVTRLDAIKSQIEAYMIGMGDKLVVDTKGYLTSEYEKAYLYSLQTLEKGTNEEIDKTINKEYLLGLLLIPYSGLTMEVRMWKCVDKIVSTLIETLQTGLVQGKTITEINNDIKKKLKTKGIKGYNNFDIKRVVRTESIFTQEQAISDASKKAGVDKYRIIVTKDERTCKRCMQYDGKVFLESDRQIGLNAPPFHPQCRCVTAPVVEEK